MILATLLIIMIFGETPLERAEDLLKKMSLDQKIHMVHGSGGSHYVGYVAPIPELKIPALTMNDGPQGFRTGSVQRGGDGSTTAFPSGLTVAASWNRSLAYAWGKAMGEEFRIKGSNVQLGPGVNVARVPRNGRNFEYISGEDPYLGSQMVVPAVKGIQDTGVIANAKHFINNNQETQRNSINEIMDIRVHMELYAPVFEAAVVEGNVGSLMCSYNKITLQRANYSQTQWACENLQSLTNELRDMWKFQGWVMSDWGATHGTELDAMAGLDQEMPGGGHFGDNLKKAIQDGDVPMSVLDEKVLHILTPMYQFGLFDRQPDGDLKNNATSPAHDEVARELARGSMVLVKNSNILPLTTSKRIIVVGDAGRKSPTTSGNGSGHVVGPHIITGWQGLNSRTDGDIPYFETKQSDDAVEAAQKAEAVVYFIGTISGEGNDRGSLSFDQKDLGLISAIAKVNKNVIVVTNNPGAVLLPFNGDVAAILVTFLPGQEFGNAVADIMYGDINPSGKLPMTFPNKENEQGFTEEQWPGVNGNATYSEGMMVGYRWYDKNSVDPLYEFGFGLSYTTFEVNSCSSSDAMHYSCEVKNTGKVSGAEVVQLYLGFPQDGFEPPKVLKGFEMVFLKPGESQIVKFELTDPDVSIFDASIENWKKASGTFTVHIGTSSRKIVWSHDFTLLSHSAEKRVLF